MELYNKSEEKQVDRLDQVKEKPIITKSWTPLMFAIFYG